MHVESIADGVIGLAHRWALCERAQHDPIAAFKTTWRGKAPPKASPLSNHERGALMVWVRREMERSCIAGVFADAVRESGLAGEREVLAYCVGRKLGGPFEPGTGGWHSLALTLCEAAGWPS